MIPAEVAPADDGGPATASDAAQAGDGGHAGPAPQKPSGGTVLHLAERYALVGLLLLLILGFSLLRPHTFATVQNWQTILADQATVALAAFALIVPLSGGRFDLSVGSVVSICEVVAAALMAKGHAPLLVACLAAVAAGALIGCVNGILVGVAGINSLVATLGISTLLDGAVQWYTGGTPISSGLSPALIGLGGARVAGIPTVFLIMLAFAIIVAVFLERTRYGRELASIGSNVRAARLVGVKVESRMLWSFVISGSLAAVAGILTVGQQGAEDPGVTGISYILPALAAVFLGATVIRPGKYNVPGTLVAVYFVGVMVSGLALLGATSWVEPVFDGAAVVIAVGLATRLRRRRTGVVEVGS
jgi:ribose transport system permease protein